MSAANRSLTTLAGYFTVSARRVLVENRPRVQHSSCWPLSFAYRPDRADLKSGLGTRITPRYLRLLAVFLRWI